MEDNESSSESEEDEHTSVYSDSLVLSKRAKSESEDDEKVQRSSNGYIKWTTKWDDIITKGRSGCMPLSFRAIAM